MKKYLISYGDDNFAEQREFLKETALASSFFDEVQIFTPDDFEPDFINRLKENNDFKLGGGYWIWKPYLIKRMLDKMETDDILIYCDAGCMINGYGEKRFNEYIEILNQSITGTIDFELPHAEYEYTKQEVFDHFKSSDEIIYSNQLESTILLLRNCQHTKMLVNLWYDVACNYFTLFTEAKQVPQHQKFIAHRHDQSIFSVIRKTYGANIIPDETYFFDFLRDGRQSPIWATRLRRQ